MENVKVQQPFHPVTLQSCRQRVPQLFTCVWPYGCSSCFQTIQQMLNSREHFKVQTDRQLKCSIYTNITHNPDHTITTSELLYIRYILLPTTCFSHSFDHHQVEKMQVQNGKKCYIGGLPQTVNVLKIHCMLFPKRGVIKT